MPNHRKQRANSVVQGTAPVDFWPQTNMLRQKKIPKQTPGKSSAVCKVVFFHSSPCRQSKVFRVQCQFAQDFSEGWLPCQTCPENFVASNQVAVGSHVKSL